MILMSDKTATKPNTRQLLIETGIDIMLEKGFNNTGLNDVLNACKVPKGSFYHHFQSKEDFGLQVINSFDENYVVQLDKVLKDKSISPLGRIIRYINEAIIKAEGRQCSRGCLIANLSQEMADQNEIFRERLKEIMLKRRDTFASVLKEAQQEKEIKAELNPVRAAEFFLCSFEGAIMRSKVMKNTEPLVTFKEMFFEMVTRAD